MQMNKAILKNSEIAISDKKYNFAAAWVSFFSNPLDQKQFFFHVNLALGFSKKCFFYYYYFLEKL